MKTIAQQLNIKEFPFKIKDKNGNLLYHEDSENYWEGYVRDENGRILYDQNSDGFWSKYKRDENGYIRYYENSNNYWYKCEIDEEGNTRYYENSDGEIIDNRVKEMTISEAEKQFNIKIV